VRPREAANEASSPPPASLSAKGDVISGIEGTAETAALDPATLDAKPAISWGSEVPEASDDAEARAADYLDQLQRLKAEFDNYRRRTAKEREVWFVQAQAELAEGLLPVLDDVRRAREHEVAGEVAESEGWRLILKRFEDTLERLGLETQGVEPGREFDPEQHNAVMAEPSAEVPEGTIIRVLEPGYLFRGRLLRRSRISYSTGPAGE
jgi:molecular chaperone GrpE